MRLYVKTVVKKTEPHDHNDGGHNRLDDSKHHSDVKKRPASRLIANSFRASDECRDRIVEPKNADLADDVGRGPCNGKHAEYRRPEQTCDKKCEDAAEIRREHRNGVQERAAFQLHSRFVHARRRIRCLR